MKPNYDTSIQKSDQTSPHKLPLKKKQNLKDITNQFLGLREKKQEVIELLDWIRQYTVKRKSYILIIEDE